MPAFNVSHRIPIIRASIEYARTQLFGLSPGQTLALTNILNELESELQEYQTLNPNTDSLYLKFSSDAILRELADKEEQDEDDVVEGHLEHLRSTMDCIAKISVDLMSLKVHFFPSTNPDSNDTAQDDDFLRYPKHKYISSIMTYTVESGKQGLYSTQRGQVLHHGSEYRRFSSHKTALQDLSTLLEQQTAVVHKVGKPQSTEGPHREMAKELSNIQEKVDGWCKEMGWLSAAFEEQEFAQV
ncbi:MAG: hypothetical protein Q9192_006637 [Flavoplaca navasiana]